MGLITDKTRFMLKREEADAVNAYRGPAGEMVVNKTGFKLHLQNAQADGGRAIPGITRYVEKPMITSPIDGSTGVGRRPSFTATNYSGDGDHMATHWQISKDGSFQTVDFLTGDDESNLLTLTLTADDYTLDPVVTYFARCRYKSTVGGYSEWSDAISFVTAAEAEDFNYSQRLILPTGEGLGDAVKVSNNGAVMVSGEWRYDGTVQNEGRARIYRQQSNGEYAIEHQMSNPNPTHHETHYGRAVAVSGDGTVVAIAAPNGRSGSVSASWKDGVVYMYRYLNEFWYMEGLIASPTAADGAQFGASLSLNRNGTRLVVGEPMGGPGQNGAFHVFEPVNGQWRPKASASPATDASMSNRLFGLTIDQSDDTGIIAVGAPGTNRVFLYQMTAQLDSLATFNAPPSTESSRFGEALSMSRDGLSLVVGAPNFSDAVSVRAGRAYQYVNDLGTWRLKRTIVAPDAMSHQYYGRSVATDGAGAAVLVAAPKRPITFEGTVTTGVGAVDIWREDSIDWGRKAVLLSTGILEDQEFGSVISVSGDSSVTAVGTPNGNGGMGDIHIYLM